VIKLIVGAGEPMIGRLLLFDALKMKFRELKLRKDPACPICSEHPTQHGLIDYDQFCGIATPPAAGTHAAAAAPGAAAAAEDAEDAEDAEEGNDDEEALPAETAADLAQLDEDDELAEDMLEVAEEVDLADSPEPDAPGDFDEEL
jgi:hypothetical protein